MNLDSQNSFLNFLKTLVFFTTIGLLYRIAFGIYHYPQFSDLSLSDFVWSMTYGIRFDLVTASYFAFLYSLIRLLAWKYPKVKKAGFIFLLLGLSGVMASDLMYYAESSRHLAYEIRELGQSGLGALYMALTQHTWFMVFHILVQASLIILIIKKLNFTSGTYQLKLKSFTSGFGLILLFVLVSRGGIQMIPIKPEFAYQLGNNQMATLALNGAFSALYESIHARELKPIPLSFPNKENEYLKLYKNESKKITKANIWKRNIVFVLLEGWSIRNLSSYNGPEQNTPNFDRFKKEGFSTNVMLADGHRTTEGIFSTFCSYPNPLGKTVAQNQLQNREYRCLPEILSSLGWQSAFFQGSLKETSGTGSFAQSIGFKDSFGRMDIRHDDWGLNYWGKHDGDIYSQVLDYIDKSSSPFLIGINTNSTHDQVLPKNWKPKFKTDDKNLERANIINYADSMLGDFAEKLFAKHPDTILVLVADHTSHVGGNIFDEYAIPFAIYGQDIIAQELDTISTQRDISPTLANYLGVPTNMTEHFTGVDLFYQKEGFSMIFHQGSFAFSRGNLFSVASFTDSNSTWSHYQWNKDSKKLEQNNEEVIDNFDSFYNFIHKTQELLFEGRTKEFRRK